jgi:hypothetical protein
LEKLQASFSRSLPDAGAEHDDAALCQSLVTTRPNLKGLSKGDGVANVVRLSFGAR